MGRQKSTQHKERRMDIKVKMAVTFLVVAAVACVAFCTFVFLSTYGSDEDERRAIVDFITNCVEEVAGQGRVSNVTEIMTMCASFASDPPITMTTNTHEEG